MGILHSAEPRRPDAFQPRAAAASPIVRIAENCSELLSAYQLVYHRYLENGYVGACRNKIVYKPSFGLQHSRTIVALSPTEDNVIGTITIVGDNGRNLEVAETYPEQVAALRSDRRTLAEVTCLCIAPKPTIPSKSIFLGLTKFAIHHGLLHGYSDLLLAVHPRHYPAYLRTFRATKIGPERAYASANGSPAFLCQIDLGRLALRMSPRFQQAYFMDVESPESYGGPAIKPEDHRLFCHLAGIECQSTGKSKGSGSPAMFAEDVA